MHNWKVISFCKCWVNLAGCLVINLTVPELKSTSPTYHSSPRPFSQPSIATELWGPVPRKEGEQTDFHLQPPPIPSFWERSGWWPGPPVTLLQKQTSVEDTCLPRTMQHASHIKRLLVPPTAPAAIAGHILGSGSYEGENPFSPKYSSPIARW